MKRSLAVLVVSSFLAAAAQADTIKVPADFGTIQQAVDNAGLNDSIVVSKGTYPENVLITGKSSLSLRAKGKVIVSGNAAEQAIGVFNSDHITLKGFSLTGGTLFRVVFSVCSDSRITKCKIGGGPGDGLAISDCMRMTVDKNQVGGVDSYGIRVESITFSSLLSSSGAIDSTFTKNRVQDTGDSGMRLQVLNCSVTKNRVIHAGGNGIEFLGPAMSSKNRVIEADVNGVVVESANVSLIKDKVTRSADDAFELKNPNCALEKCSATRAGADGFRLLFTATGNALTKCKSNHAGGDGFEIDGTTNTLVKCKATQSGVFGLNDTSGGATNTYTHCNFDSSNLP